MRYARTDTADLPAVPDGLNADEAELFLTAARFALSRDALGSADSVLLAMLAAACNQARTLDRTIADDGVIVKGKPHKLLSAAQAARRSALALARACGLGPNVRANMPAGRTGDVGETSTLGALLADIPAKRTARLPFDASKAN